MGDSIAVGTQHFRKECVAYATGGLNSHQWLNKNVDKSPFVAKTVIISLGTNDWKSTITAEYLYDIRNKTKANAVVWILPSATLKPTQRAIIKEIANEFKDKTMDISQFIGPDGIHPHGRGYQSIARNLVSQ